MSLYEKAMEELKSGMDIQNQTDIFFVALWISRREDESLVSTACKIEEEKLKDDLREDIARVLRNIGESVFHKQEGVIGDGPCPNCCDICKHGNCSEMCKECNPN